MSEDRAVEPVQSVDRALTILEALARAGVAGVTEVAAELDVHKSTAFRLMSTLESHDLVEQTGDRGKYRLGVGVLRLAGATTARLDVVQEARQICRRLAATTGETVNLAVLSGHSALYLDQVAGSSALQSHNWVGPAHPAARHQQRQDPAQRARRRPAAGRARQAAQLHRTARSPRRRRCITELAEVRERGYAVAVDELEQGLTAVAAPIRNAHGDIIASMSVSGASFRLQGESLETALKELVAAAAEVSFRLGWNDPWVDHRVSRGAHRAARVDSL